MLAKSNRKTNHNNQTMNIDQKFKLSKIQGITIQSTIVIIIVVVTVRNKIDNSVTNS